MVLQRWDPIVDLRRMEETMNRLWRGSGGRSSLGNGSEHWHVPLDVVQEDDNIIVHASVPGIDPNDIRVDIEDGVLTVSGQNSSETETKEESYLHRERRNGSYHRSLKLPDTVDAEKAESNYEHGVLTVTLPKQEAKKAKRIEVKIK